MTLPPCCGSMELSPDLPTIGCRAMQRQDNESTGQVSEINFTRGGGHTSMCENTCIPARPGKSYNIGNQTRIDLNQRSKSTTKETSLWPPATEQLSSLTPHRVHPDSAAQPTAGTCAKGQGGQHCHASTAAEMRVAPTNSYRCPRGKAQPVPHHTVPCSPPMGSRASTPPRRYSDLHRGGGSQTCSPLGGP